MDRVPDWGNAVVADAMGDDDGLMVWGASSHRMDLFTVVIAKFHNGFAIESAILAILVDIPMRSSVY